MRRRFATCFGAAVLVVLAGCSTTVDYGDGSGERSSQIDRVVLDADVRPNGTVQVSERVTFAGDDGGTIALGGSSLGAGLAQIPITLPPGITIPDIELPPGVTLPPGITIPRIPGLPQGVAGAEVANVAVDGAPAQPTTTAFGAQELEISKREATVTFDVAGAVEHFPDIAVLDLPALPSPEDASRQDPDVELSGTITFPGEVGAESVEAHLLGGRDREIAVEGGRVRFSSRAPIWAPGNSLYIGFPPVLVPEATQFDNLYAPTFTENARVREENSRMTEDVLTSVDDTNRIGRWIVTGIAIALPAIFFLRMLIHLLAIKVAQRREVSDVPDELSQPPTNDDPAVVGVLWSEGKPEERAVAGTMLALAHRKAISIDEYGERLVVRVPLMETGERETEALVLHGLRENATPDGVIEGPPIWRSFPQWRAYRRAALKDAARTGYITRTFRLVDLNGFLVVSVVGLGLYFSLNPALYAPLVIGATVIGTVFTLIAGYGLNQRGRRARALWKAFGEYVEHNAEFKDVGPQGVAIWGPYLVYGAVLGEAKTAARPLTP